MSRRSAFAVVLLAAAAPLSVVHAQDLRTKIRTDLFTFGTCGEPLCLEGALAGHGSHFIPATQSAASDILDLLGNSLAASVSNVPVSATSSGVTYEFVGGLPVKTSTSGGAIFGERAQTLGRGRFFAGYNVTSMHLERLRGVRLDGISFNFTHQNIAPTDTMGSPEFENDVIRVDVAMNINLLVNTWVLSYGLVDGVDLSVAVPVVHLSMQGTSVANILPFGPTAIHPSGLFNPTVQRFPAVDNLIHWNHLAPRIGAIYDVGGDGTTLLKFNYGQYWFGPGLNVGTNANPNSSDWWQQYSWPSDLNHSGVWEPGEEGAPLGARGGRALESPAPDLQLPIMREVAAAVERELFANVGIRTGLVWRGERQHYVRQNANRPFNAFTVPVVIQDPGPDGKVGTEDDGPAIAGYDITPETKKLPQLNIVRNVPDADSHYLTWDITATRRFSKGWSLVAGFAHTWNYDQANAYSGQPVRQNTYPLTPNDLINAGGDGEYDFRIWSAKIYGTYEAPWGLRITPYLRHQSGQPFGRTFSQTLNYGTIRILAEPIDTRRMDNITLLDVRIEKGFRLAEGRRLAGFIDGFNLLNANPAETAIWTSGTSFLRPLSIVAPRIVRIGTKLEW